MLTIQAQRTALAICQDLHSRAVANDDTLMVGKWQAEIDRISSIIASMKDNG